MLGIKTELVRKDGTPVNLRPGCIIAIYPGYTIDFIDADGERLLFRETCGNRDPGSPYDFWDTGDRVNAHVPCIIAEIISLSCGRPIVEIRGNDIPRSLRIDSQGIHCYRIC